MSDLAKYDALRREAASMLATLDKYGPGIIAHFMDTDDNAGQRLRELLALPEDLCPQCGLTKQGDEQ